LKLINFINNNISYNIMQSKNFEKIERTENAKNPLVINEEI
jgi:hypothetical protein